MGIMDNIENPTPQHDENERGCAMFTVGLITIKLISSLQAERPFTSTDQYDGANSYHRSKVDFRRETQSCCSSSHSIAQVNR